SPQRLERASHVLRLAHRETVVLEKRADPEADGRGVVDQQDPPRRGHRTYIRRPDPGSRNRSGFSDVEKGPFQRAAQRGTAVAQGASVQTIHRLLVVDDEPPILFAMGEYLTGLGYKVDLASEREEAEALICNRPYSAVVADLRLLGSDSREGLLVIAAARE